MTSPPHIYTLFKVLCKVVWYIICVLKYFNFFSIEFAYICVSYDQHWKSMFQDPFIWSCRTGKKTILWITLLLFFIFNDLPVVLASVTCPMLLMFCVCIHLFVCLSRTSCSLILCTQFTTCADKLKLKTFFRSTVTIQNTTFSDVSTHILV
jgi:hypothetical protein